MNRIQKTALAAGTAFTLIAGIYALPASAAPLATSALSVKAAAPATTTDVQWRRGRRAGAIAGAVGLGIIAGAAIANSNRGYYAEPYGYYDQPYGYAQPYGYDSYYYGGACADYGESNVNLSKC